MILCHRDSTGKEWFFRIDKSPKEIYPIARRIFHNACEVTSPRTKDLRNARLREAADLEELCGQYEQVSHEEFEAELERDRMNGIFII